MEQRYELFGLCGALGGEYLWKSAWVLLLGGRAPTLQAKALRKQTIPKGLPWEEPLKLESQVKVTLNAHFAAEESLHRVKLAGQERLEVGWGYL
ncbi:MAG: hypothetical protein KatS3mg026_0283 [Bacteroidia bacterium]|nr:MAG: hypothetical protein KatS3mg026_0283 [Bacteroidia bacterium]